MPRVNLGQPSGTQEIYEELFGRYGGTMTKKQVAAYIGLKDFYAIQRFLENVPSYKVDGKSTKYRVRDIAKRMAEARE